MSREGEREKESVKGREGITERGLKSVAWVGERVERKEGRRRVIEGRKEEER